MRKGLRIPYNLVSFVSPFIIGFLACTARGNKSSDDASVVTSKRIAIIGGSISGSFFAKYITDYDAECQIDSITIYDPYEIPTDYRAKIDPENSRTNERGNIVSPLAPQPDEGQGPRVSSVTLSDGSHIEMGASIIYSNNQLVVEMMKGDPSMKRVEPYSSRSSSSSNNADDETSKPHTSFGIYNGPITEGSGTKSHHFPFIWPLVTANLTNEETRNLLLWRYNLDLWRMHRATSKALHAFESIYNLLYSTHFATFFESSDAIWDAVGLKYPANVSLDTFLDAIHVSHPEHSWLLRMIGMNPGRMREEFITSINLCNNNQNNSQLTALAGLVNFVASQGELFSIQGGNNQLIRSAFEQANRKRQQVCKLQENRSQIQHVSSRIKTVVNDFEKGMELFDGNGKLLGTYDLVILAAPLQFCDISFLTRGSLFDSHVLSPMVLNGMVDSESSDANEHGHLHGFGKSLPDSAIRPYTQVVTTIISNGIINKKYFSIGKEYNKIPDQILMTVRGSAMSGFTSITELGPRLFKTFSSEILSQDQIKTIFGEHAIVEVEKIWGGKHGGATPDFNGGGESSQGTNFLLFDGGDGVGGESDSSALYYTNTMESAVAAIEISAIGAKAVAKLVAQRLGFINMTNDMLGEEL